MLETIKECIGSLPETTFSDYYQDYVMTVQKKIAEHRIEVDSHRFLSIDNMCDIIVGLNKMTEELRTYDKFTGLTK